MKTSPKKRLRREIRALSPLQWSRVVRAFKIAKALTTAEGRRTYGPAFVSYDDMVLKHARAALDNRGDQAHWGPIFPVFHRLFNFV